MQGQQEILRTPTKLLVIHGRYQVQHRCIQENLRALKEVDMDIFYWIFRTINTFVSFSTISKHLENLKSIITHSVSLLTPQNKHAHKNKSFVRYTGVFSVRLIVTTTCTPKVVLG